jgi:hypothetical protein
MSSRRICSMCDDNSHTSCNDLAFEKPTSSNFSCGNFPVNCLLQFLQTNSSVPRRWSLLSLSFASQGSRAKLLGSAF